jgi:hypothetical protein
VKKANISVNAKRISDAWRSVLEVILPNLAALMGNAESIYEIERSASRSKEIAEKLSVNLSSLESIIGAKFKDIRAITTA